MRMIISASFGFALAASAFALATVPASALEAPAVSAAVSSNVMKVYDDDRRDWRERREREDWRERHEREEARERREREEARERRERAERCEHVRHECRERAEEGGRFRRCMSEHGCY